MLNFTQAAQAQNSYNNSRALNNFQGCNQNSFQGGNQNPMMMMAMTLMTAALFKMMGDAMGQNAMMPTGPGFGGNNNQNCGCGNGLDDFLGGQNYGNNGCASGNNSGGGYNNGYDNGYNNGYNQGYNNGANNSRGNNSNTYDNNSGNNTNTGNTSSTGKTSGVGKDLPEGINNISYAKACELVKNAGGQLNPDGKPTVLAIRSDNSTSRSYQDAFLVLKPDGTMEKFAANTRPTSKGQDKAMLKEGEYQITPRWKDGKFSNDAFVVGSTAKNSNVAVARDANGDGQYDDDLNGNASSSTIRLHRGKKDGTTSSAGCLNVKDYDSFLNSVGGDQAKFNMVLVSL